MPNKNAIIATFEAAAKTNPDMPGGCLIINTALELSPHDPEIAAVVDARMLEVENFFFDRITEAAT